MKSDLYIENSSNTYSKYLYLLIGLLLVGSHQFNLQLLPYFLIIFLGKKEIGSFLKDKTNFFIVILLISSLILLLIKGYPLLKAINVSRFYFGLPFIYLFLSFNLLSKLKYPVIIAFIAWNFIELAITLTTGNAPFYIQNYALSTGAYNAAQITKLEESARLLGPALNSSINGAISACILVASVFNKELIFGKIILSKFQKRFISILSGIIFFFSASGTGFLTISILLLSKYIIPTILNLILRLKLKLNSMIYFITGFISIIYGLILIPDFLKKYDFNYYSFIFDIKLFGLYQFFEVNSLKVFLIGKDLGLTLYLIMEILSFLDY